MSRSTTRADRIARVVYQVVSAFVAAFWVMLAEGAIGGDFGWPTFSYWQSFAVVIGLGSIVQYGTASMYWGQR